MPQTGNKSRLILQDLLISYVVVWFRGLSGLLYDKKNCEVFFIQFHFTIKCR